MAMSAAHRAAISAGMKRYWATKRGGSTTSTPKATKVTKAPHTIINIDTGNSISREEAARVMFGSRVAAAKLSKRKRR